MTVPARAKRFPYFIALSLVLWSVAGAVVFRSYSEKRKADDLKKGFERLTAEPSAVLGENPRFRGNPSATLTIVEFGDYQCPPCRRLESDLKKLVEKNKDKLRMTFRNLPLRSIHPLAVPTALLAETEARIGDFWQAHDRLIQLPLSVEGLRKYGKEIHCPDDVFKADNPAFEPARKTIERDEAAATSLGLTGTPSLLLLDGEGVKKFVDLESLRSYIEAKS